MLPGVRDRSTKGNRVRTNSKTWHEEALGSVRWCQSKMLKAETPESQPSYLPPHSEHGEADHLFFSRVARTCAHSGLCDTIQQPHAVAPAHANATRLGRSHPPRALTAAGCGLPARTPVDLCPRGSSVKLHLLRWLLPGGSTPSHVRDESQAEPQRADAPADGRAGSLPGRRLTSPRCRGSRRKEGKVLDPRKPDQTNTNTDHLAPLSLTLSLTRHQTSQDVIPTPLHPPHRPPQPRQSRWAPAFSSAPSDPPCDSPLSFPLAHRIHLAPVLILAQVAAQLQVG